MKKRIMIIIIALFIGTTSHAQAFDVHINPNKDSSFLSIYDSLTLFLMGPIEQEVADYYESILTESPMLYPYQIDVQSVTRIDGFRSFSFRYQIEVEPVVGPHIAVGRDLVTLEVSPLVPSLVKVTQFNHLETYKLPPQWEHIEKNRQ
ncbi:hypothetical protein JOC54_000542 [Alkalihalobacillus xiaoxiensis]|uniref:DUF3888 domain-containing protein n=1 Tax=Shouchella xiaoxiensis TaxID=766895 RepID=A0ABS2SQK4_9BACI|nr:DUF3888 domain-containing protein [Shouchella xiaoxiensis]MBM7837311.1 hypothetical protein [Shouchella xiaoxiensis]